MSTIKTGAKAPDFTLTDHKGKPFNLVTKLAYGPVLLIFYTLDGSPTCTSFLCAVNEETEIFARHNIQVVGINYADADRHTQMAESKYLQMPLLSDNQYQVAKSYDSLFEIGPIKAIRYSVVGIERDGTIRYFQRGRPDNAHILAGMGITAPTTA